MKLHAKFETLFRNDDLTVDLRAESEGSQLVVTTTFFKNDRIHFVKNITKKEIADLCREAAEHVRRLS